jgi:hypothetical protein
MGKVDARAPRPRLAPRAKAECDMVDPAPVTALDAPHVDPPKKTKSAGALLSWSSLHPGLV